MNKIEMGKMYKTRNGEAVRVLCLDSGNPVYPVVAVVCDGINHIVRIFTPDGRFYSGKSVEQDLIEYNPLSGVAVDTKILVRDSEEAAWQPAHFARPDSVGAYAWVAGATSFTTDFMTYWKFAKIS